MCVYASLPKRFENIIMIKTLLLEKRSNEIKSERAREARSASILLVLYAFKGRARGRSSYCVRRVWEIG